MDLIERLEFEEYETNTTCITAVNKIYAPLEPHLKDINFDDLANIQQSIYDKLISFKFEKKVHLVYAVSRIFTTSGKLPTLAKAMAEVYQKIFCSLETEYKQKYNFKEILKDQLDKEINFVDKIKGYYRQFEEIHSILKKNQYTNDTLGGYLFCVIFFLSNLFHIQRIQCDILSPKMIYKFIDKLYYITDMELAKKGFINIIVKNWEKLEWTHHFYLHRYFRLIERLVRANAPTEFDPKVVKQRNTKWLTKNETPSNYKSKLFIAQENWTMQFKQTVRNFFNARKIDCLACDEPISTHDKKQLLKHYSKKSYMEKLQDKLISLYNLETECAICANSETAEDHKDCNHDEVVKKDFCLSCCIFYDKPQIFHSHFETRVHIYESLGLYGDQTSEVLKKQMIIRESRKFAIPLKHKPKHVTSIDVTESINELEQKRYGTGKELHDFLQGLLSKVEAEMNALIKKVRNRGHRGKLKNYRLLVEYTEETMKVEDLCHSIISEVRPFYKLKKYTSEMEEKQFIESILKSEPTDGPEDGGPFSASEDEDDIPLEPPPYQPPPVYEPTSASLQPPPYELLPAYEPPPASLQPPPYQLLPPGLSPPPGLPHPPAPQSPSASAQLEESKLAIPTKAYSKEAKSSEGSSPVSPGSDGSPSKKDSPKSPSTSVEPPAEADDQPPPSKGAIPKTKAPKLTSPEKSKASKDSSPTPPASSGDGSPGGGDDDPGAPGGDGSGGEELLPNGGIKLRTMKEKSFEMITDLINQQKGNDPENIVLAKQLEFFLGRLYFSDFIPFDAMAACIDHFIEDLESEEKLEQK